MDRIWQWTWDRYPARYSWAFCAILFAFGLPIYLFLSFVVVALEHSDRYTEAAAITAIAVLMATFLPRPFMVGIRLAERWAAGHEVDRVTALEATYTWARGVVARIPVSNAFMGALVLVLVGAIAGAGGSRLVQYGIVGAAFGAAAVAPAVHSSLETAMRPIRTALVGEAAIGDALPRSRPSFTAWLNVSMLAVAFTYAIAGAMLGVVFDRAGEEPLLLLVIGCALTMFFAVPITTVGVFAPSLRPINELAHATARVAAGDYSQRLPVVQDDDLGALAASFNRMQAGLTERQRLQAAFGTYVDPGLAARLLEQGDDVFTGERREVTVMFVDIRDFTPFAESNPAEDVVARLNALFEIVVPAVVDAGGHVNKFLGDGALAVFGAPNDLVGHADAAVSASVAMQRLVAERFEGALRIGIGINTGVVIAGTIGGGGKLEFTLIGDAVNVAARVEQLTKTTGDSILLTQQAVDALESRPAGLIDRGSHVMKGKSAAVKVFGLDA